MMKNLISSIVATAILASSVVAFAAPHHKAPTHHRHHRHHRHHHPK